MKRRREHGECDTQEDGRGCLVFGTKVCTFRKPEMGRWKATRKWLGSNVVVWWIFVALLGIVPAFGLMLQLGARMVDESDQIAS